MVFAHRHYLKAGRDMWVHQRPYVVSTLATFAESSWNGTANCSGPITEGWVLITRGWSREGRGSLLRGPQDSKGWVPYKAPQLKKYPHLPPTAVLPTLSQDQAAPHRPARALGRDRHRVGVEAKQGKERGEGILWGERRLCNQR